MPFSTSTAAELRELRRMGGLGPYLGIFYGLPAPGKPRFGHGGDLFRLMTRLAPGRGLFAYVFTPESLLPSPPGGAPAPEVAGWFHDGREWVRGLFPWPDVLYDRSIADSEAENQVLAKARSQFPTDLPVLNSWPLVLAVEDKWRTHQILAQEPQTAGALPVTALYQGVDGLRAMMDRFGAVVLKERYGHKARGVAFVRHDRARGGGSGAGTFSYTRDAGGRQEQGEGLSWPAVEAMLGAHTAGREFVVQQAIDRVRFQDRHIELRVIMHKAVDAGSGAGARGAPGGSNGVCRGRWLRTGMVCRLTDPGLPFLALGHELDERPSRVLPEVFGASRAGKLLENVRRLARLVKVLEERTGAGAELAVDFMIDGEAGPWLLEVNTRPAMLFKTTESEELRRRGVLRLLEYARCLALQHHP